MTEPYTEEDVEDVARIICSMWADPDKELSAGKAWTYYSDIAHAVLQILAVRGRLKTCGEHTPKGE